MIRASNPRISFSASATITREGNTIGASVAPGAVPFSPVPTHPALGAVPRAGVLNDFSHAERVPVALVALPASIRVDKLL